MRLVRGLGVGLRAELVDRRRAAEAVNRDDRLKKQQEILQPLREQVQAAERQGTAGVLADSIASWLPCGFSLSEVARPVHLWWGDGDALVQRADTECLADGIQGSTLTILPGEGHLFPSHIGDRCSLRWPDARPRGGGTGFQLSNGVVCWHTCRGPP